MTGSVDDELELRARNERFIGAFRIGSLEDLDAVLDPSFVVVDGTTGAYADREAYRARLTGPVPGLALDDVAVHVTGDTAVVTGRTTRDGARFARYVDVWRRTDDGWRCVLGCNWPVVEP